VSLLDRVRASEVSLSHGLGRRNRRGHFRWRNRARAQGPTMREFEWHAGLQPKIYE
jgi:hypothetical protein